MKPILFSTPMVQAILAGRKTQTRRVIVSSTGNCPKLYPISKIFSEPLGAMYVGGIIRPRYQNGDVLWVRETWRIGAWNQDGGRIAVDYKADGFVRREWLELDDEDGQLFEKYWLQSSEDAEKAGISTDSDGEYHWEPGDAPTRWRPSIHMPREAARLFLRVTDVRADRLQEITEADAKAEGIGMPQFTSADIEDLGYAECFADLWNSINDKRGFGWEANPWVWVISFERIEKKEAEA